MKKISDLYHQKHIRKIRKLNFQSTKISDTNYITHIIIFRHHACYYLRNKNRNK
jgi:hypothetical protein